MKTKRTLWIKRGAACTAGALWLGMIFYQSLCDGQTSAQYSGRLTRLLQWLLHTDRPVEGLNHLVRKIAHFAEFFLLGALVVLALVAFGLLREHSAFNRHGAVYAVLAGVLPALFDETLQLLSAGRSSRVGDVWLDWAGYLCGFVLCLFCAKTVVKSVKKRYDSKE